MATKSLSRAQAKAALGDMNERTFALLVAEGIPREGDGREARYPWPEVWHWYLKRERAKVKAENRPAPDQSLAESERRELAAKAELAELKVLEARGVTCQVSQAEGWLAAAYARVRSKLANGPRQVALRVTGQTIPEREAEAHAVFDEIMGELAAGGDVPEGGVE